ncbi:MAG TPA: PsiF family protein [Candidatus Dormibacteraeota bacterium]|nr:PsiF family protein [Candidatus Dormibacteraeota bacterium]
MLVGTVTASPADDKKLTPQQEKMKTCNADAADKKGDDRKAFMSQCLKGGTAAPMTQQDKMKKCNVDAGDKKGDERKAFMSQCLKSDKKS